MSNKQAGGIVSFIIVAIALAGLLAGGLYLSKYQGRVARDNDTSTPQVATPNQEEQKKEEPTTPGNNEQPGTTAPSTPPTNNQNQQTTPPQPAPSTSQPQRDRVANTGPSEELPVTGPGETAAVTLAVSALAFTGYKLFQSRRGLRRSALQQ